MRSASGQGTVEYVGVLLVVALLMAAMLGGVGVPRLTAGIAASILRAVAGEVGLGTPRPSADRVTPSRAERDAFARAVDPAVDPDERSSLRDVRLDLIARHGDVEGRARYRELVLEDLRRVVPGLGGPTLFATASPGVVPPRAMASQLAIDERRSLSQPAAGDEGEVETPEGAPNAHTVTVTEADHALDRALHPGVSYRDLALDAFTVVPVMGGAARLVVMAEKLARGANALDTAVGLVRDAEGLLAPDVHESPAGSREGDEIVSWAATRRPANGGPARRFARTAVVRDGVAIYEGIERADG
jgi:hypothetical protein